MSDSKWSLVLVKSLGRFKHVPVCCVCGYVAHLGDRMYRYIKNESYGRFTVLYKCEKCYNNGNAIQKNEKQLVDVLVCMNCGRIIEKTSKTLPHQCVFCYGPLIHVVKVKNNV